MSTSVATKLETARVRLEELGRLTDELTISYTDVFLEGELRTCLDTFKRAYNEAQARLAEPTLSIATIGTTSSGKSTIVNALVGRRIAPIEAGEMSGGVLTLRSSNERRLTVEEAEGAPWDAGTWAGISDADAYDRIRDGVMRPYHEARKARDCHSPQVISEGPLLPSIDASLLGLPADLGLEFIDLPGLKSVKDRTNLQIIQARVNKAFGLVTLDYMQTDEEHRKMLLEELKHVVQYLGGRTDSTIFVLNRVDQRGMDDEPIEARVEALRREIKDILGLQTEPDVLPFEARLLYRAQCAWGASDETHPTTTSAQRLDHLRSLFEESASSLKRRGRERPDVRSWLRDLEDQVDEGIVPSDDDLRTLLQHAQEWSGGKELWQRLRARIEESFAELVILPALIEVLDTHKSFTDGLRAVSRIRKIDSQGQLEQERHRLEQLQTNLHEDVGTTRERFRTLLTDAAEGMKSGDQSERHQLTKKLGVGFESLLNAINEVTGDLITSLIAPVRDALKMSRGVYDLQDEMNQVLNPAAAKELVDAYDRFSRRIPTLSREEKTFTLRVSDDDDGLEQLHETERDARRLYKNMSDSLIARAEFKLQGQAESIRRALTGLLEQQADDITAACLSKLPDLSLEQAIESARRARSRDELLALPPHFFPLPEAVEQHQYEQEEVVGQREEEDEYIERSRAAEGSLGGAAGGAVAGALIAGPLGAVVGGAIGALAGGRGGAFIDVKRNRTITHDIKADISYQLLTLPDEDGMARQWDSAVKGAEDSLWETLRDWMIEALRESSINFSTAIDSVLRLADRALEQQQKFAASEHEVVIERWKRIDGDVDRIIGACNGVHQSATSKHE